MSIVSLDNKKAGPTPAHSNTIAAHVLAALAGLRFGSVELVVHEGRVVQIDRHERLRLEQKNSADA